MFGRPGLLRPGFGFAAGPGWRLPPGSHDADGREYGSGTAELIGRIARRPWAVVPVARRWRRHGCRIEALALIEAGRPGKNADPLRLHLMAELGLYSMLLAAAAQSRTLPAELRPALGLARAATGDPEGAIPLLLEAIRPAPRWGLWMRAAAMLALIAPQRAATALAERRHEPLARLVLAHLAERHGDYDRALALLGAGDRQRPAEAELLRGAILSRRGDAAAACAAEARALASFGLLGWEDTAPARAGGPIVTIIVAAHQAETTIEGALGSLRRQSWRALDIIVVDDASTDATADKVAALAAADPRIRLLREPANWGAYAARNRGLAAARGEFITTHDADDWAHPQRVEMQLAPLLADRRRVGSLARWVRCEPPTRYRDRQIVPLVRQHVGSLLLRRGFSAALGGFDPVRYGADGDLLARAEVAGGAGAIARLPLPLTRATLRAGSAVHDPNSGYGERGYSIARQRYHETCLARCVLALSGRPIAVDAG